MNQNGTKISKKRAQSIIQDVMKALVKKCSKKVTANSPRRPETARETGLGALNKGNKVKPKSLIKRKTESRIVKALQEGPWCLKARWRIFEACRLAPRASVFEMVWLRSALAIMVRCVGPTLLEWKTNRHTSQEIVQRC